MPVPSSVAFLIRLGIKYKINEYIELRKRGIRYICNKQNKDGSWFYAGKPERSTIDCFHQSLYFAGHLFCKGLSSFDTVE